jgi:hypothetical protein
VNDYVPIHILVTNDDENEEMENGISDRGTTCQTVFQSRILGDLITNNNPSCRIIPKITGGMCSNEDHPCVLGNQ